MNATWWIALVGSLAGVVGAAAAVLQLWNVRPKPHRLWLVVAAVSAALTTAVVIALLARPSKTSALNACATGHGDHYQDMPGGQSQPSGWALYASDGNFHLVHPGKGGRLYQVCLSPNGKQSVQDLGGKVAGTPAIVNHDSQYIVFALDPGGGLWQRTARADKWNKWSRVSTKSGDPIKAMRGSGVSATWIDNGPQVFLIDPNGRLSRSYYSVSGGWQSENLDSIGKFTGTPAVVYTSGKIDLFATDTNGQVFQRTHHSDTGWDAWHTNKGRTSGATVTALKGAGVAAGFGSSHLRLFSVGPTSRELFQTYFDALGWHSQELRGNDLTSTPAVAINGDRIDVFVINTSGNIYQHTSRNQIWENDFHFIFDTHQ